MWRGVCVGGWRRWKVRRLETRRGIYVALETDRLSGQAAAYFSLRFTCFEM
jgi:hypothetical protein